MVNHSTPLGKLFSLYSRLASVTADSVSAKLGPNQRLMAVPVFVHVIQCSLCVGVVGATDGIAAKTGDNVHIPLGKAVC